MINTQSIEISQYQKRFWLEWKLNPNSITYNTPLCYEIHGPLNVEALSYALTSFVNHHDEGCRSYFAEDNTGVKQIIYNQTSVKLEKYSIKTTVDTDFQINEWISHQIRHVFDLNENPLYKFSLLFLENKYILFLNFHHIISDSITASCFIQIISNLYNNYLYPNKTQITKSLVRFSEYIKYEKNTYTAADKLEDLTYWENILRNTDLYLNLPTRHDVTLEESKAVYFHLDIQTSAALKKIIKDEHSSMFILLASIFGSLLLRYANQSSFVINYPVNMRPVGYREKTGCFVNNVLFKIAIAPTQTFKQLLKELTAQRRLTKKHQRCSLTDIIQYLREKKILCSQQFFNIDLYEAFLGFATIDLHNVVVKPVQLKQQMLNNDLGLAYQVIENKIQFKLEYQHHKFEESFISNFIDQLKTFVKYIINDINHPIYGHPLLTTEQYHTITQDWNRTCKRYAKNTSVIDLFENMAEKYPYHTVIKHRQSQLSYTILNKKVNQFARYLIHQGIGVGNYVGIYIDRSPDLIVCMLAVLKIGAAYVPLDLKLPQARLDFIIQDANLNYILTKSQFTHEIKFAQPIEIDTVIIKDFSSDNINLIKRLNQTAYVIYTSGTTGSPKGVVINHAALANHNYFATFQYDIHQHDRILQLSTINFDISVEEIFIALTRGATLVLYPDELGLSFSQFKKLLLKESITVLDLPTAFWHVWVHELEDISDLGQIKLVIVGGESASLPILRKWLQMTVGKIRWLNTYGPTEATIISTVWEPNIQVLPHSTTLPIGRPITNSQLYIVDDNLNPVPIGVTGELMISGENLAEGYLHQPVLTAEKFIPNPFTQKTGDRLYRTGDLARYQENGNIEFIGRIDQQIKIRGYRVELGEIESVLNAHPQIKQAIVNPQVDNSSQLIAYIVPTIQTLFNPTELKIYLLHKLPEYMLPTIYLNLDEIPLTANGKVDRKNLPIPVKQSETDNLILKSDAEKIILDIWCEALNMEVLDLDQSFFDLGGHSLLMIKIHKKLEIIFKRDIPIVQLFQYPTIRSLAGFLQAQNTSHIVNNKINCHALKQRNTFEKQRQLMKRRLKQ